MVGIGLVMLLIALMGALLRWRGRLEARWFARLCAFSSPLVFRGKTSGGGYGSDA
jgi:cytochrome d ubiquinol oxidase subunit I